MRPTRSTVRALGTVTLVVHAALAAIVYRDARGRDASGSFWAAATLVSGLFGVAGYAYARRR